MEGSTRNKGGRPEKEEGKKAIRILQVRWEPEEYNRLVARKLTTTARSLSDFVRSVCLEKPLLFKNEVSTQDEKMLSLLREIRIDLVRIGVNINQSSKRINSTTDYQDLQRETLLLSEKVVAIEQHFNSLLANFGPQLVAGNGDTDQ
ncbi:MobC family plasmid mobilization relaxosome protein [Larkinella sp. C7]|uniref:MobC family plasmid mobilization relaxosome protein n=1 Tax=Larkinella sp. C7 TaxID=2576607 RepID=UPI00111138B7|nr:MobC family plasmid mobilization relaxosome protein [Larkinella sp. C7]